MNILVATNTTSGGGAAVSAHESAKALRDRGHNVTVLTQNKKIAHASRKELIILRLFSFIEKISNKLFQPNPDLPFSLNLAYTTQYVQQLLGHCDVIHLHYCPGLISRKVLQQSKAQIFWTLHDQWPARGGAHYSSAAWENHTHSSESNYILRKIVAKIAQRTGLRKRIIPSPSRCNFIAPSHWIKESIDRSERSQPNVSINVVGNPLSSTFSDFPANDLTEIPQNSPLIIAFFGKNPSLTSNKGFRHFISVATLAHQKGVNLSFMAFLNVKNSRSAPNLPPNISISPPLSHQNLVQYLAQGLVVSMLSKCENLPNICIEAQAMGCPVVGFDVGGVSETRATQESLLTSAYGDISSLFKDIQKSKKILTSTVLRREIANTARQKFAAEKHASFLIENYHLAFKEMHGIK